jgi:SAM-dependent methyltransferase
MNKACVAFGTHQLTASDIRGRAVMEVGSRNVNGSLRSHVEGLGPASYIGVDILRGPGVDEVCPVDHLLERFGPDSFDVVFSTEMLEHVRDWRAAVTNLKGVTKPGGILLITTRSQGFGFHGYPFDFWRFEIADMAAIFADFELIALEPDESEPGVFLKCRKPAIWKAAPLDRYVLYSIVLNRRALDVRDLEVRIFRAAYLARVAAARVLPAGFRRRIKKLLRA